MDVHKPTNSVRFGGFGSAGFRFHRSSLSLYLIDQSGEKLVKGIARRALQVLNVLIEEAPETVSKDVLLERVWKNATRGNVDVQIKNLRRVLENGAPESDMGCVIENVPRRGYRFARELKPVPLREQPTVEEEGEARAPDKAPTIVAKTGGGASPRADLSIVVLPFANFSGDRSQQYFADGITEDLTTDLSRFQDMLVISRKALSLCVR
jgi:DNA-binding winged helix-turn-helix (wHTH) protein